MGSWNYRLVKYRNGGGFGIHEVFYDEAGKPWGMTEAPAGFSCDTDEGPDGLRRSLDMMATDVIRLPVLDEPEVWPGQPPGANAPQDAP